MCWQRLGRIHFHFRMEETKAELKGCRRVVVFKGIGEEGGLKYFSCGTACFSDMQ